MFVRPQGSLYRPGILAGPPVDDGEILLVNPARLPHPAQAAGCFGIPGNDNHAGGFAIEAIDELRMRARAEMQAGAADETRECVPFCGVADQPGGLVDDKQFRAVKEDCQERIQRDP